LAKCSPPPHTRAAKFLYGGAAFSQKGGCIYQFPNNILYIIITTYNFLVVELTAISEHGEMKQNRVSLFFGLKVHQRNLIFILLSVHTQL